MSINKNFIKLFSAFVAIGFFYILLFVDDSPETSHFIWCFWFYAFLAFFTFPLTLLVLGFIINYTIKPFLD